MEAILTCCKEIQTETHLHHNTWIPCEVLNMLRGIVIKLDSGVLPLAGMSHLHVLHGSCYMIMQFIFPRKSKHPWQWCIHNTAYLGIPPDTPILEYGFLYWSQTALCDKAQNSQNWLKPAHNWLKDLLYSHIHHWFYLCYTALGKETGVTFLRP